MSELQSSAESQGEGARTRPSEAVPKEEEEREKKENSKQQLA